MAKTSGTIPQPRGRLPRRGRNSRIGERGLRRVADTQHRASAALEAAAAARRRTPEHPHILSETLNNLSGALFYAGPPKDRDGQKASWDSTEGAWINVDPKPDTTGKRAPASYRDEFRSTLLVEESIP